jgi:hypothetical protein
MALAPRLNTFLKFGRRVKMIEDNIYELEEFVTSGNRSEFVKTRSCGAEHFDEIMERRMKVLADKGVYFHLYRRCGDVREILR